MKDMIIQYTPAVSALMLGWTATIFQSPHFENVVKVLLVALALANAAIFWSSL